MPARKYEMKNDVTEDDFDTDEAPTGKPRRRAKKHPFEKATPAQIFSLQSAMLASWMHGVNADGYAQNGDPERGQQEREQSHREFEKAKAAMKAITGKKLQLPKNSKLKPPSQWLEE